jgi:pimeloyl-ACP methyl ester carboxylesterase
LINYPGLDGTELTASEVGDGRVVVLVHGLVGSAQSAWVEPGHAQLLASAGMRVVMPDLRGHGASSAAALSGPLPRDVLVDDLEALVSWLGVADGEWDLAGYSLGGQLAARLLLRAPGGPSLPGRAVIGGAGLSSVRSDAGAGAMMREVLAGGGDPRAAAWLDAAGVDRAALAAILDTFEPVPDDGWKAVAMPVLVACGADDERLGAARALAAALACGEFRLLDGDHVTAALAPRHLGEVIAGFLGR